MSSQFVSPMRFLAVLSLVGAVAAVVLSGSCRAQRREAPEARPRPVVARGPLEPKELEVVELFENAAPGVVYITTSKNHVNYFSRSVSKGAGSGFIWDDQGHVVTNLHVVANADSAEVTLSDQTTYRASFVGGTKTKDLAVLRIEAPPEKLKQLAMGSSHDLRVGQEVYAIGNPFGLDHTLTRGIISALGREIESLDRTPIENVIQTDAAINPGNSGGPLLDSAGRLIGVNTQISSPSGASAGIGFAIPVDTVNWVVPELINNGRLTRPGLGVQIARDRVARREGIEGVIILDVEEGSAAEYAGLRGLTRSSSRTLLGDVIVAVDGEVVRGEVDLHRALAKHRVGDEVLLTVVRRGRELVAQLELQALK